ELALHLARYGDGEAARKLVDPADAATLRQIDKLAGKRNIPLEWTRVVALLLHGAQVRLATGDLEGGSDLMIWHRQAKEILGGQGPLSAVLLPRGRKALALAEKAWREEKHPVLAEQAKTALASWGEVAESSVVVPLGSSRDEVAHLLRSQGQ